jgi:hypothetical protein
MPTTDAPRNIPVPDELADVRAKAKALEQREAELKAILLSDPSARTGAGWIAEIREIETNRVDIKELRAMHKDLVEEYTFPTKVTRVELSAVDADTGEIVSARQFRNKEKAT